MTLYLESRVGGGADVGEDKAAQGRPLIPLEAPQEADQLWALQVVRHRLHPQLWAGTSALNREEVFMEGPLELNMGPSLADVLLCAFESTNAGFSSFPVRKPLS